MLRILSLSPTRCLRRYTQTFDSKPRWSNGWVAVTHLFFLAVNSGLHPSTCLNIVAEVGKIGSSLLGPEPQSPKKSMAIQFCNSIILGSSCETGVARGK